jgi:hypothetical protein
LLSSLMGGPDFRPEILTTERVKTAWYEVDPQALETMVKTVSGYDWLEVPPQLLRTMEDVLQFAEHLLEASCPKWLMGWRDVCRATDERTTISGLIPQSGVGHKFLLMIPSVDERRRAALLAILSSLSFDYVARQKLGGTSFNYFTMKQLTAPHPDDISDADLTFIVPRVLELTYTSHSMKPFAEDLGYKGNAPFPWDEVTAARSCARSWTPRSRVSTASPATSCATSSTLPM